MSSGGESLSYFPLSFIEALHLGVIYAGMGHQCQELRGRFFEQPIRMALPVQFLVSAVKFFDCLPDLMRNERWAGLQKIKPKPGRAMVLVQKIDALTNTTPAFCATPSRLRRSGANHLLEDEPNRKTELPRDLECLRQAIAAG